MGIQSPHQPGIGLKPGNAQTPPANVLQVVKQVQEEAARQQAPHVGYGKVNPGQVVPGQTMPPPQMRGMAHLGAAQGKICLSLLILNVSFINYEESSKTIHIYPFLYDINLFLQRETNY